MRVEVSKPQSREQQSEKDLSIGPNSLETRSLAVCAEFTGQPFHNQRSSSLHLPLLKEHWYYRVLQTLLPNMALRGFWGFKLRSFLGVTEPSSQHKRILGSLNLISQDQTESTHSTKYGNKSRWQPSTLYISEHASSVGTPFHKPVWEGKHMTDINIRAELKCWDSSFLHR